MNNLLESIDNGVGDVVENTAEKYDELYMSNNGDEDDEVGGRSSVDDILAKRGLLARSEEDEGDGDDDEDEDDDLKDENNEGPFGTDAEGIEEEEITYEVGDTGVDGTEKGRKLDVIEDDHGDEETADKSDGIVGEGSDFLNDQEQQQADNQDPAIEADETTSPRNDVNDHMVENESDEPEQSGNKETELSTPKKKISAADHEKSEVDEELFSTLFPSPPKQPSMSPNTSQNNDAENERFLTQISDLQTALAAQKEKTKSITNEKNASLKETRKLRRNLVKLNAELDSVERELEAQGTELDRAAARMEKDRLRHKEEKEKMIQSHKEDIKVVNAEHKASISAMVDTHSKQIADMEGRIERAEEVRMKEGGDMSAELADAAEREREMAKSVQLLEEEKATYALEVSSLKTQIVGLESRIESLKEASESATEMEREADDKLDKALSLHMRQMSQRQAREAELERTVADLSASLVATRGRESDLMLKGKATAEEISSTTRGMMAELKDKLMSAKDEVEMLDTQLMMEKQKAETLQQELLEVTNEQAFERSQALQRQKEYDDRVADLMSNIAKLQSKQHSFSGQSTGVNIGESSSEAKAVADKLQKEIATLSEDLIRQKAKLQHSSTEVQTLRNRLKSALSRAEIAEKAAQAQSFDVEGGSFAVSLQGSNMRQKYGVNSRKNVTSIRSAFRLDSGRGETKENLGKIVDVVDAIAIDAGSYFRSDPVARAVFLFYILILHLWTFFVVMYHAHGHLEPAANVGPEELLKHSYRHAGKFYDGKGVVGP